MSISTARLQQRVNGWIKCGGRVDDAELMISDLACSGFTVVAVDYESQTVTIECGPTGETVFGFEDGTAEDAYARLAGRRPGFGGTRLPM